MSSDRKLKESSFDDFYFPGNRNTICEREFVSKLKEMKAPKEKERLPSLSETAEDKET